MSGETTAMATGTPLLIVPPRRTASRTGSEQPIAVVGLDDFQVDLHTRLLLRPRPRPGPQKQKQVQQGQRQPTGTRPAPAFGHLENSVIVVRDPPRERLPRSRSSADSEQDVDVEDSEAPLARITGKPDIRHGHGRPYPIPIHIPITTTVATYYDHNHDHNPDQGHDYEAPTTPTTPTKSRPSPSPRPRSRSRSRSRTPNPNHTHNHIPTRATTFSVSRKRDPDALQFESELAMAKKRRGSLQAIFVPSFLNALGAQNQSQAQATSPPPPPSPFQTIMLTPTKTTTPASSLPPSPTRPTTPGTAGGGGGAAGKYASRMRALSVLAPAPPSSPSAGSNTFGNAGAGSLTSTVEDAGAAGFLPPPETHAHARKRSNTFSFSFSSHSSSNASSSSSFNAHSRPSSSSGSNNNSSSSSNSTPSSNHNIPTLSLNPSLNPTTSISPPRSSPPPAFFIDDDPFANLTAAPVASMGLNRVPHPHSHSSGVVAGPSRLGPGPGPVTVAAAVIAANDSSASALALAVPPVPPLPSTTMPRSPLFESPPKNAAVVAAASSSASSASSLTSLSIPTSTSTTAPSSSTSSSTSTLTTPALTPSSSISSISSITSSSSSSSSLATPSATPSSSSSSSISSPTPVLSTSTPTVTSPQIPSSPPPLPRPPPIGSTNRTQTRPAYQRPAFASRPSLPSLDTLARMNVVLTKKVRKGRVGAGLPFEPWDNLPSDDEWAGSRPNTPVAGGATSANLNSNSNSVINTPTTPMTPSTPTTPTSMTPITPALSPSISSSSSATSAVSSPILPFASSPALSFASAAISAAAPIPIPARSDSILPLSSISSRSRSRSSSPAPVSGPGSVLGSMASTPTGTMPQPLLPSQILTLGSVAEDVEMVLPLLPRQMQMQPQMQPWSTPGPPGPPIATQSMSGSGTSYHNPRSAEAEPPSPSLELSFSASRPSEFAGEVDAELVSRSTPGSRRNSRDGLGSRGRLIDLEQGVETDKDKEADDGYFGGAFLDRYQSESEDGHGVVYGQQMENAKGKKMEDEEKKASTPATARFGEPQPGSSKTSIRNLDSQLETRNQNEADDLFAPSYSSLYQAPAPLDNDDSTSNADPNTMFLSPGPSVSGSLIFSSSPPSFDSLSLSLSRSVSSSASYSSLSSADSSGAVEHADHGHGQGHGLDPYADADVDVDEYDDEEEEEEIIFGSSRPRHYTRNREYRRIRLAEASHSLSSLELDLELDGEAEHELGGGGGELSDLDKDADGDMEGERGRDERGDSTRSSSSHPSLSRTRSSSDASEVLSSPVGDYDYSFFPYSRARELRHLYGQHHPPAHPYSGSALFAAHEHGHNHENPATTTEAEASSLFAVRQDVDGNVGVGVVDIPGNTLIGVEWQHAFAIDERERMVLQKQRQQEEGVFHGDSELPGVSQGFGFGFDRVAGEVLDEKKRKQDQDKETKSLAVLRAATASIDRSTTEEEANAYLNSPSTSSYDHESATTSSLFSLKRDQHQHQPQREISRSSPKSPVPVTDLVSQNTSPPTPDHLHLEHATMLGAHVMTSGSNSPARLRMSTMKTMVFPVHSAGGGDPYDSSGYRAAHGQSTSSSTSQSHRIGSSHGQSANGSSAFKSAYSSTSSRSNHGRRRENSDDEDEERRRRRALERMLVDDGRMKSPSSSEDEDEPDRYDLPTTSSIAKSHFLRPPWNPGPVSRSSSTGESFVTASSGSPSLVPMDFPSTSSNSSQYPSEDERNYGDEDEEDDDDVPLAQRIPGALKAQKSMRLQFREHREQRKQEKALRLEAEAEKRARQMTLRPAGAGGVVDGSGGVAGSSSHDAALLAIAAAAAAASSPSAAQVQPRDQRRQRTLTLPAKSPAVSAFNPHDLATKLQNVQLAESPTYQQQAFQQQQLHHLQHQQQLSRSPTHISKSISRSSGDHRPLASPPFAPSPPALSSPAMRSRSVKEPSSIHRHPASASPSGAMQHPPLPTLRPMRSFHRPSSDRRPVGMDDLHSAPLPPDADHRLGRSSTTSTNRSSQEGYRHRSSSQSRVSGERPMIPEEPVPPLPVNRSARPSIDYGIDRDQQKKLMKAHPSPEMRLHSTRTSVDADRPSRPSTSQQQVQPAAAVNKVIVSQQRVFVGNLQQFHMVEIGPSTTAGDIIAMMDAQGILSGWAGSGGWMLFEIAQDFGMERPIRSFELLADVQSSWLKDKTVNYFVLKLTPLAVPLRRSAIPSSSPTHSGYVEWEVKKGKWSKRWLQLREHSLWLSKRDNRKDEVLICSLSNFDAYQITRNHRAPKPYAFAVKSTDNLSFFESAADYLHNFSCSEKDGAIWTEKILVARSYVLHQERQVLFNPKSPTGNPSTALSRSGTKKYPSPRPLQPLVPLPHNDVFEPGSLLAKHI